MARLELGKRFIIDQECKLGKGVFGIVYQAIDKTDGNFIAVKEINIKRDQDGANALAEVKILQQMRPHPNLVHLRDFTYHRKSFWIFLELCNMGDLDKFFIKYCPDKISQVEYMCQIASAVSHLHSENIVHRDLKSANILVTFNENDERPMLKISDFGLTKMKDRQAEGMPISISLQMTTNCGTPFYMAPEIFANKKYNKSVDVFAMGLLFFSMLAFKKGNPLLIPHENPSKVPKALGKEMNVAARFKKDPAAKVQELVEIKGEEFEKELRQIIRKMIEYEPDKRMKSVDCLREVNTIFEKVRAQLPPPPARPKFQPSDLLRTEAEKVRKKLADKAALAPASQAPAAARDRPVQSEPEEGDATPDCGYNVLRNAAVEMAQQEESESRNVEHALKAPVAALLQALFHDKDADDSDVKHGLRKGQRIRVGTVDTDVAEQMQKNHGGWSASMENYLGKSGNVDKFVLHMVQVKFTDGQSFLYNPNLLENLEQHTFKRYDVVELISDMEKVKAQQKGHGGWNDGFIPALGSRGVVNKVDGDGDVYVEIAALDYKAICFNSKNLKLVDTSGEEFIKGDKAFVINDMEKVKELQQERYGGWSDEMQQLVGHTVTVAKVVKEKVYVRYRDVKKDWILNKKCLVRIAGELDSCVHWGAKCEHCGLNPIKGLRYLCKTCSLVPGYNLCEKCIAEVPPKHGHDVETHEFDQIRKPLEGPDKHNQLVKQLRRKLGVPPDSEIKPKISAGDIVLLDMSKENAMELQEKEFGGWASGMEKCLGKTGIVEKTYNSPSRAKVEFDDKSWYFNMKCLTKIASAEELLKQILKKKLLSTEE